MSYPLRLPPELDAEARARCERLGISLNAFIAVALDAYLRGLGPEKGPKRRSGSASRAVNEGKRAGRAGAAHVARSVGANGFVQYDPDPDNFRNWHNPDMWPYVDPEAEPLFEGVNEGDIAALAAVEAKYWATRQRPS